MVMKTIQRLYDSFLDIDFEALDVKMRKFQEENVKIDYVIYITSSDKVLLQIFPLQI
jgi:hypothetical protein